MGARICQSTGGAVQNRQLFQGTSPWCCSHSTRLSNGFSRKMENHAADVALNYFEYNFVRIHRALLVTPAIAAGVTDRRFEVSDLVTLLEAEERVR